MHFRTIQTNIVSRLTFIVIFLSFHSNFHALGKDTCDFSIWRQRELTSKGVFGKHFGKLVELYDVKTLDDCARSCLHFRFCYLAQYEDGFGVGYCTLYYYNFPPLYKYEVRSPVRIRDVDEDDGKAIIFNLTSCDEKVSYKHPCKFDTYESEEVDPIRTSAPIAPYRNLTALNAEDCAMKCGQDSDRCVAAVFNHRPVAIDDVIIHSSCELYNEIEKVRAAIRFYAESKRFPVLIASIECYNFGDDRCAYGKARKIFKDINSGYPPDKHYGAKTPEECATICGHYPRCLQAQFDPAQRKKECLLYRDIHVKPENLIDPPKGRTSIRMVNVDCRPKRGRGKRSFRIGAPLNTFD